MGCRTVLPKRAMIRLVRQPEGVKVDPTGKLPGRGAYLHNLHSCWEKGIKGPLARALKTELTTDDLERLRQFMQTLPAGEEQAGESG
ncbi:MAG TPA: YlxR family protein [Anaerolineales bacterium]|nr:YlxR family protein [Anaerolineales bacterium]